MVPAAQKSSSVGTCRGMGPQAYGRRSGEGSSEQSHVAFIGYTGSFNFRGDRERVLRTWKLF